ncbi:MAG: hypothetical protein GX493_08340 [Firmicutes bacterium]|nr:hypothetical protein [Bacillota bacterium]
METRLPGKRIAPAALHAPKEALALVFWYKSDLRSFLTQCLTDPNVLARLNWQDYKRTIVAQLVDYLSQNEDVYQRQLLRLMSEVARIQDFSHLERLEDGKVKAKQARAAVEALRTQIAGLDEFLEEEREIERRRQAAYERILRTDAVRQALERLSKEFCDLLSNNDPHGRGYRLERILRDLFDLFDLDPKASFKITGEQIDGAFTFANTDYLLEAKWQKDLVRAEDLDSLAGKLSRKLDNTLGLYIAINGYSEDGIRAHSSGRRLILLMDGSDLMAVLEGRIDLVQLLLRKRRAAAQTGNIYLRVHEILMGDA